MDKKCGGGRQLGQLSQVGQKDTAHHILPCSAIKSGLEEEAGFLPPEVSVSYRPSVYQSA